MSDSKARRRTGGRSERVMRAVFEATVALLGEAGLDGLTVDGVATRAGVNKVTIYRRWGTRERLVAEALAATVGGAIRIPDLGDLRSDLLALAVQVRDVLERPQTLALMRALAAGGHHPEIAGVRRLYWARRLEAAREIVDRAVWRGELAAGTDADELVIRVVGPIWFSIFGPGRKVDDGFLERAVDAAIR